MGGDLLQMIANSTNIGGVHQRVKLAADKLVGTVTQTGLESGIREVHGAVCAEDGDDFPDGVQQRRKLCGPESDSGVRDNSLSHLIVASLAGVDTKPPAGLAEASKGLARTRKRQLKVNRLLLL